MGEEGGRRVHGQSTHGAGSTGRPEEEHWGRGWGAGEGVEGWRAAAAGPVSEKGPARRDVGAQRPELGDQAWQP